MDIGIFIPIGNNGWLISTSSPQYRPTFELNKQVVQRAEHYGFDFALSMIKLRGFGGKSEFWDHNLESFTLMAGLAAVTKRIQLYASVAVLTIPPAIVARMTSTIDSISRRPLRHQHRLRLGQGGVRADGPVARRGTFQQALRLQHRVCDHPARAVGNRHIELQGPVLPDGGLQALAPAAGLREDRLRRPEPARNRVRRRPWRLQLRRGQGRQHADRACGDQQRRWPRPPPRPVATSATTCC